VKTFFDVGANDGTWGIDMLRMEPDSRVFAFEPTPKLCDDIRSRVAGMPNYHLVEKAVSDIPGKATFHLSELWNWGCSSLLPHRDEEDLKRHWTPSLWHVHKTGEMEVECITMKQFVEENGIESIDYFHCDVQGMDLRVLQSFGDKIYVVKAGEIECAANEDRTIYQGQTATVDSCTKWLKENGFVVDNIQDNQTRGTDGQMNEFNAFRRP
jgi:FkbM family methyltransferase